MNPVYESFFVMIDRTVSNMEAATGTFESDPQEEFPNAMFRLYIEKHGVPTTEREARRMFEFAAVLLSGWAVFMHRQAAIGGHHQLN